MSLMYQLPHTARYVPTSNTFTAAFNVPTVAKYDFGTAANTGQRVIQLFQNTVYLIERVSIGGNISEEIYADSIESLPFIVLKREVTNEIAYKTPFPVNNYIDDKDIVAWILSEKQTDYLTIDFTGILKQTAALVGVPAVSIFVNYSIYAVEDTRFYNKFRDTIGENVGNQVANR